MNKKISFVNLGKLQEFFKDLDNYVIDAESLKDHFLVDNLPTDPIIILAGNFREYLYFRDKFKRNRMSKLFTYASGIRCVTGVHEPIVIMVGNFTVNPLYIDSDFNDRIGKVYYAQKS
ncbi:MAG: hypothetical protein GY834_10980 [Bacteroidetes bacterium]|nr:hypothetical protein [Bacteroidota bacterium]